MNVTLSLASSPPRIQDASPQWLDEFGLELQVCRNRTLNLVLGPDTHAGALARLITTVQHGKQAQAQLVLYSRVATGTLFHVRAQPSSNGTEMELAMSRCDVVSMAEAAREDGSVKVLLAATKPFRVVHVSSAFVSAYGFEEEHITNRTLSLIMGPMSDHNAWKEMLGGAFSGSAQEAHIQTYTRHGAVAEGLMHVRATPVTCEGTRDIGHLLIEMGPEDFEGKSTRSHSDIDPFSINKSSPLDCGDLNFEHACSKSQSPASRRRPHLASHSRAPEHASAPRSKEVFFKPSAPHTRTAHRAKTAPKPEIKPSSASMHKVRQMIQREAAKRIKLPCQTSPDCNTHRVSTSEAGFFSSIMAAIMTILSILSLGVLSCSSSSERPRRVTKVALKSAYKRNWELLHYDGMSHSDLEGFTVY